MLAQRVNKVLHAARRAAVDWAWAGDWTTWYAIRRHVPAPTIAVRFRDTTVHLHLRPHTLDLSIARLILREDSEYRIPVHCDPRLIVDIGANIGMTSLYFGLTYPRARIIACEPETANLNLLRANTAVLGDRITIVPMAVGATDGVQRYAYSADARNMGGGTFVGLNADLDRTADFPMTTLATLCRDLELESIDILKVDTEGSEWAILGQAPDALIRSIPVIIGELHGVRDFDVLGRLLPTHDLGMQKQIGQRCFPFVAVQLGVMPSKNLPHP